MIANKLRYHQVLSCDVFFPVRSKDTTVSTVDLNTTNILESTQSIFLPVGQSVCCLLMLIALFDSFLCLASCWNINPYNSATIDCCAVVFLLQHILSPSRILAAHFPKILDRPGRQCSHIATLPYPPTPHSTVPPGFKLSFSERSLFELLADHRIVATEYPVLQ